jgi:hypothetical protein
MCVTKNGRAGFRVILHFESVVYPMPCIIVSFKLIRSVLIKITILDVNVTRYEDEKVTRRKHCSLFAFKMFSFTESISTTRDLPWSYYWTGSTGTVS